MMYLDVSSTYLLILVILFDISYRWIEFEFLRLPEFDLIQFIDQRSLSRMTRIQPTSKWGTKGDQWLAEIGL